MTDAWTTEELPAIDAVERAADCDATAGWDAAGVTMVETDGAGDEIDAAYRAKYGRYTGIVDHVLSPEARAATLKLVPR